MEQPSAIGSYLAVLARPGFDALMDGDLLSRFHADRDEAAFAELVRRHGGMALAVARRVLRGDADADDCVQAAFLVLAQRAGRFTHRLTVGDFLHGVALRVALKSRTRAARRHTVEARAARPEGVTHAVGDDLAATVDRAVQQLPRKLRDAVVLCDLEGVPRKLAAQRLGVPEGTLSSRLTAAHRKLAGTLAPPAVVLAMLGTANIPEALAAMIVRTAAGPIGTVPAAVGTLVTEVSTAMLIAKLKPAVLGIALLGLTATGAGVLQVAGGQDPKPVPGKVDAKPKGSVPNEVKLREEMLTLADAATGGLTDAERAAVLKKRDEAVMTERVSLEYLTENDTFTHLAWVVKRQTVNGQPVADTDGIRLVSLYFSNTRRNGDTGPLVGPLDVAVTSQVRRFGREPAEDSENLTCVLNPHRTPKEMTLFTRSKLEFNVPQPVPGAPGGGALGGGGLGLNGQALVGAVDIPNVPGGTVAVGPPVMTQYVYELKGNTLRLATYKNWGEADRPHGFTVAEQPKNGADLWVIELEREKPAPAAGVGGS